jgi:GT2 family glycosyltransferase
MKRGKKLVSMSQLQVKKKEPKVSIVIVNWNRKKLLEACLNSLEKTTEYSNYSMIVVDNGSSDGSSNLVESRFPSVNLLSLKQNMGFAIGNNIGIANALQNNADYVLLLNNDTLIIQRDWLRKMVESAEENEEIGIIGCKLIYPNGKVQHVGSRLDIKGLDWINPQILDGSSEVFEVDVVLGACFLIKRKTIDIIGFLDEGFSPFQQEESDFCFRAKKAGFRVCTTLSVKVVHLYGASRQAITSDYFNFIHRKNQIRLMLLNFSVGWLVCHSVYEIQEFASCLFERKSGFQKRFLFRLEIRKDWQRRTSIYLSAWFFNARNLGEILAKRRNRAGKILPATDSFNNPISVPPLRCIPR